MRSLLILALCLGAAVAEDRAYLGVGIAPAPEGQSGLLITQVTEESAAAAAGLREGDILVEFDGRKIETIEQLLELIRSKQPGEKVSYLYRRGEGSVSGTLALGKREVEEAPDRGEIEERIERARHAILEAQERVERLRPTRPAGVRGYLEREERMLERAVAAGQKDRVSFHEARIQLLREMMGEERAKPSLEQRVRRLEEMMEKILERLER